MEDWYNNDAQTEANRTDDTGYQQSYPDPYQQPIQEQLQNQYREPQSELEEPVSMGEWLISMLILLIPCVNIVMMFVWAFSTKEKKSKSNYFKACLIFTAIVLVIYIILIAVFGVAISSAISSGMYY